LARGHDDRRDGAVIIGLLSAFVFQARTVRTMDFLEEKYQVPSRASRRLSPIPRQPVKAPPSFRPLQDLVVEAE